MDEARDAQGGCGRASGAGEATREERRGGGDAEKAAVLEKANGGGAEGARGTEERKREKRQEGKVAESEAEGGAGGRGGADRGKGDPQVDQESMTMAGTLLLGLRLFRLLFRR